MTRNSFIKNAKEDIKKNKFTFFVYLVLRFFVIVSLIMAAIRGEYENVFVCTLSLVLFLVPSFIERSLKIEFPSTLEIIMLLFIFSAEILGEIHNYYVKVPYWDTVLHTLNGFLFAAIGFSLLDIINRNPRFKFQLSPMYLAIVAFCFSMTIGVLWEFFEFGADFLFNKDMQKDVIVHTINSVTLNPAHQNIPHTIDNITSVVVNGKDMGLGGYLDIGLYDTMKDLIVNFIGAIIFSVIGYFYIKGRGKGKFAKKFIPVIEEEKEQKNSGQ
ncbi:MAG: hypothetical protein IJC10_04875 [Clostridia bacterium]|nr:hypothetical protein [Clostridia bacterium]